MFESPVRVLSQSQVEQMNLKFYNSDIHRASFALPQFVKKVCVIKRNAAECVCFAYCRCYSQAPDDHEFCFLCMMHVRVYQKLLVQMRMR